MNWVSWRPDATSDLRNKKGFLLIVDNIRKIWKTEFLPNIKKEIRNELKTEIEKINHLITNLSKRLDSIESSQQLISDKYDSVLKSMQSTKKKMKDLNNKYKFLCNTSANIDFPNYKFYSTDSKTMAGGAGIYISSSLNAIHRSDLSFNFVEAESCGIEILQEHKPSIIVGCIYRHSWSNLDNFISQLENLVIP